MVKIEPFYVSFRIAFGMELISTKWICFSQDIEKLEEQFPQAFDLLDELKIHKSLDPDMCVIDPESFQIRELRDIDDRFDGIIHFYCTTSYRVYTIMNCKDGFPKLPSVIVRINIFNDSNAYYRINRNYIEPVEERINYYVSYTGEIKNQIYHIKDSSSLESYCDYMNSSIVSGVVFVLYDPSFADIIQTLNIANSKCYKDKMILAIINKDLYNVKITGSGTIEIVEI